MKKILLLLVSLVITARLFAQDCSEFVYMQKGKTIETTGYSQGGGVMFKTINHVLDVSTTGGTTVATVETEHFDKNGQSKGKKTVTFKCNGGSFFFDMSAMGGASDNIKFSASNMEYPANMKVGDHLKDIDMKMEYTRPGNPPREMNAKITDRQVLGKESITTPAGTWNALKITYQTKIDMPGMPMTMPPQTTTEWYVPNFGIVQWDLAMGMTMKITSIH
jgi:hypothetical protein